MSENKLRDELTNDPLLDHNYDGIQELDNPLPRWWVLTFYGTIIFAVLYVGYFHVWDGTSIEKQYKDDLGQLEFIHREEEKKSQEATADLSAWSGNAEKIKLGKEVYASNCISCHGAKAEGGIGPNLTDEYWLHGNGSLETIAKTIRDGVGDKGMPPWSGILSQEKVLSAASYVESLSGSKPANAKAPQGNKVK